MQNVINSNTIASKIGKQCHLFEKYNNMAILDVLLVPLQT